MATPFEVHRGAHQLRRPGSAEGSWLFELGHARHLDVYLALGDRHEVSRTFDPPAQSALLRCRIVAEVPELPPGRSWLVEARLNGVVHYRRRLAVAGRVLDLEDAALRLAGAPAGSVASFRLELA